MRNLIITFSLIVLSFYTINAQTLNSFFTYSVFNSTETGPYVETYLSTIGKTAVFSKNENGKYQADIGVTIVFKQNGKVIKFKKFNLKSPEVLDSLLSKPNFLDQQRFSLKNGEYDLELLIKDNNSEDKPIEYKNKIEVNILEKDICVSGIQFIEKYTKTTSDNILSKGGLDLVPYISDFFPKNMSKFMFYTELYNTNKVFGTNQDFLVSYRIETASGKLLKDFNFFKKVKSSEIVPIFGTFDITELYSWNYYLNIEVKNKKNEIVTSKKIFFQRSNPNPKRDIDDIKTMNIENTFASRINSVDTLSDYIASLRPICGKEQNRFINNNLENGKLEFLQKFFYNFWLTKDELYPEQAWLNYKERVDEVNGLYSSNVVRGYETDRGYIYLKYGRPNDVDALKFEANTLPMEIWFYYVLNTQQNRKVVFYNPDIVGENYILLHSNITGEISDPNWASKIDRNENQTDPTNTSHYDYNVSSKIMDLYNKH